MINMNGRLTVAHLADWITPKNEGPCLMAPLFGVVYGIRFRSALIGYVLVAGAIPALIARCIRATWLPAWPWRALWHLHIDIDKVFNLNYSLINSIKIAYVKAENVK